MTEIKITPDMIDYEEESVIVTLADGKRYRVEFEDDLDSTPDDIEDLPEKYIDAWRRDVWHYVGMIVTPLDVPESVQFELSDSLWGLEYDFPLDPPQTHNGVTYHRTDTDYQVMHYPGPDMISEVMSKVKTYYLETAVKAFIYS